MRETLCRGKREDNKEWVYGNYLYDDMTEKHFIVPFGNISESTKVNEEGCCYCVGFEVIPETVGQYTVLSDKNGDKIFDGDIVNGKNAIHGYYEKFIVVWDDEAAGFYCKRCRNTDCNYCFDLVLDIKIIGNIHDNPELLEVYS